MSKTLDQVETSVAEELENAVLTGFQTLLEPIQRVCTLCSYDATQWLPPVLQHEQLNDLPATQKVSVVVSSLVEGCEAFATTLNCLSEQLEQIGAEAQEQQEHVHELEISVQGAHAQVVQELESRVLVDMCQLIEI